MGNSAEFTTFPQPQQHFFIFEFIGGATNNLKQLFLKSIISFQINWLFFPR